MSLTLCGLGILCEESKLEQIAANRIYNRQNSIGKLISVDIIGELKETIADYSGILRAVQSKEPCDIKGKPIGNKLVKKEIVILSAVGLKINAKIREDFQLAAKDVVIEFPFWNKEISFRSLCAEIDGLVEQMMNQVPFYKSKNKEVLLLLGRRDKASVLSQIPEEVIKIILQKRIEIAMSNATKKFEQMQISN